VSKYVLSPRARADLSEIWDYSAEHWGSAQADRYVRLIAAACSALAAGRITGRKIDAIRPGYVRHPVGSHVVFYRAHRSGGIEIVRLLHRRMDIERHL
jgi:toxin ParE1/3/4